MLTFSSFLYENWLMRLFGRKLSTKIITQASPKITSNEPAVHSIDHFLDWHEKRDPNFGKRVAKATRMMRKDSPEGIRLMGEFIIEYKNKFGVHPGSEDIRMNAPFDKLEALIKKHGDPIAKKASAKYHTR